jgi:hypothetical protein
MHIITHCSCPFRSYNNGSKAGHWPWRAGKPNSRACTSEQRSEQHPGCRGYLFDIASYHWYETPITVLCHYLNDHPLLSRTYVSTTVTIYRDSRIHTHPIEEGPNNRSSIIHLLTTFSRSHDD